MSTYGMDFKFNYLDDSLHILYVRLAASLYIEIMYEIK